MSTRCSIKWREQTDASPGFHLYDDCLDVADEGQETPVYLRLDGVSADMTTQRDGATVTVAMPREMARALGLLPATPAPSVGADGLPEPDLQTDPCSADGTQTDYYTAETLRAALASRPVGDGWKPIETADHCLPALLFAPGWQLSEDPRHPGEFRVASPRNWTWATHWMPLPAAPTPDQAKRAPSWTVNRYCSVAMCLAGDKQHEPDCVHHRAARGVDV